ncbi:MAG: 2-(1,2-epoxy-1,2-dihydrophenyl)acetyl-CoA isomerase [Bacteroidetes bacterium]|nr:2-(1,2-epoxy-1,2-dihydrophenyl)acetyl-CoA isomerase [Bacteroidota bacterium]
METQQDPLIKFEVDKGVAFITLNRPDVLNSFNREMAMALQKALDNCATNKDIRAVYLTGEGRAFCAGQDLAEAISKDGPELQSIVREHYNPIIEKIRALEKPVVCAVNGVAAGAGANIALACDIVFAAESASFIQAFSKIGLIPDSGGTYFLPRLIGLQRATALMMLGDKVKAQDAVQMGMIYKAVPDNELHEQAKKTAHHLATMPTLGLGLTKRALNLSLSNALTIQLKVEEELQAQAGKSYDYNEGINAFLEKRQPQFKGE